MFKLQDEYKYRIFLQDPTNDGGQWDMISNIINKHGLMPKRCFPESFSSESSMRMNAILKSVVGIFCCFIQCHLFKTLLINNIVFSS